MRARARRPGLSSPVLHHEALQPLQAAAHHRVIERVAPEVERHQRVHPRRLDAPPRAVGLLAAHDPRLGARDRLAAQRGQRVALVHPQRAVQAPQPRARPGPGGGGGGGGEKGEATARGGGGTGRAGAGAGFGPRSARGPRLRAMQVAQVERQRLFGAPRHHQRQRHDRLARPAAEVVDVQRRPPRQHHDLRRQRGDSLPRPQPEQRQPHVREHPRRLHPALLAHPLRRPAHVLRLGRVASQAQRPVGLDRAQEVAGPTVEVGPRPILALLRADPRRRALGLGRGADPEELAQQHVLGIHRHVGLQLAAPPARLVLEGEQVLTGALQRDSCLAAGRGGRGRHGPAS